jgi:hypothetical protein
MSGAAALVLAAVDEPGYGWRGTCAPRPAQACDHALDEPLLVVASSIWKPCGSAGLLPVQAQQAVRQPWKVPTHMPRTVEA